MRTRTRAMLGALLAILVIGGVVSPATAATYTRTFTCQSTGVTGYSITAVAYWQNNSAGQADLVKIQTTQYQGVNVRLRVKSLTLAHRWAGVNKEAITFTPTVSGNTTYFNGTYYASYTTSEAYMAGSDNAKGIHCGPVVKNAA